MVGRAVVAATKAQATEAFMDILVFAQAGLCEIKQAKIRERFIADKFNVI